jgi:outer membrane protein
MSFKSKMSRSAALSLVGTLVALGAHAQQAGTWMVRGGVTSIIPQVKSETLSAPTVPNVRIDVDSATSFGGGVSYMLTDHWSLDVPLALGFKHKIRGADAIAGAGEIGTAKVLPATLFVQYRLREAQDTWRPYVGAGLTYAYFYDETGNGTLTGITNPGGPGTNLDIKNRFGFTVQSGMTYSLTPQVFLEGMLAKTFLKVRTNLSTGQTINARLDPVTVGLYVGYRF